MELKVGQYHYEIRGREFSIYRVTSITAAGVVSSSPTGEKHRNRLDARRRVYELNGWPQPHGAEA